MKNKILALVSLSSLVLTACSFSTVPTRRVHAVVTVPSYVDVSPSAYREGDPSPVGVNGGIGHAVAYSDLGNVHDSTVFHGGVNYRNPYFAAGWMPFLGAAHTNHEGSGTWGSLLWYAFHFNGGESDWRYSFQNSYAFANQVAEDKGCENETGIFFSTCASSPQSTAHAEAKARDVGFTFTVEKRSNVDDSILIVPALHWTWLSTGNKLDSSPAGDTMLRTQFWVPSLQVGYVMRFGGGLKMLTTFMAGAQWVKSFRLDRAEREFMPTADIRFQF